MTVLVSSIQGEIVMVGTPDEAITAYYALDEGDSDE